MQHWILNKLCTKLAYGKQKIRAFPTSGQFLVKIFYNCLCSCKKDWYSALKNFLSEHMIQSSPWVRPKAYRTNKTKHACHHQSEWQCRKSANPYRPQIWQPLLTVHSSQTPRGTIEHLLKTNSSSKSSQICQQLLEHGCRSKIFPALLQVTFTGRVQCTPPTLRTEAQNGSLLSSR